MNNIKCSLVVASLLLFVGCGGGGGSDSSSQNASSAGNSSSTKTSVATTDSSSSSSQSASSQSGESGAKKESGASTQTPSATKEVTFRTLEADTAAAQQKITNEDSEAYSNLQDLKAEIEKLKSYQEEADKSNTQSRALIPVNFDVTTIPARLELANELLKAIVLSATSPDYKYKSSAVIGGLTLKIASAIFAVANPFNNASTVKAKVAEINKKLVEVKNTPNQKDTEFANVNLKEDLAKVLREYRLKSFKIEDSSKKSKFDAYLLKATGVRLDIQARVSVVKEYIRQIPLKYNEAMSSDSVEGETTASVANDDKLTQDNIKKVFDLLKTGKNALADDKLGEDVKAQIRKLMKFFGGLGLLDKADVTITGTDLKFDINTLTTRSGLGIDIIKAIVTSSNALKAKKQNVHTELGFAITTALIRATNPFAKSSDLTGATDELNAKVEWAKSQPDLSSNDTATLYIKESMAKKLREYRTYQFTVLKDKDQKVVDAFNKKVLEATGVRLDPTATVQEVYNTLQNLEEAATEAKNAESLGDLAVASFSLKVKLSNIITKARFTSGIGFSNEKVKAADKVYWNTKATIKDVKDAIASLEALFEKK